MNKKLLVIIFASLATLSINAHADNAYVGLGVGQAKADVDDSGFSAVSRDEKDTAFSIFGGFQFNQNWAAEIGYTDFGKIKNVYAATPSNVTLDAKAYSVYVAGVGTLPLSDSFALYGKLGVTGNHSSGSATNGTTTVGGSGNKSDVLFGVGAQFNINKNFGVAVDYTNYGKVADDVKVDVVSVNARYSF